MRFTVYGASGFVGSALCQHLRTAGHEVRTPARGLELERKGDLGHVIFAIGVTADFRKRPFDTVEAHVGLLGRLLHGATFDSWLYLSSTRVYGRTAADVADETLPLTVEPDADGLYDLSKLTGEALCRAQKSPLIRVARLSNVYGPGQSADTFLGSLLAEIAEGRAPHIREAPTSSKDYVALQDVCALLERIALGGRSPVYNVASGAPLTHADLADRLRAVTARAVTFDPAAARRAFPTIDISRIVAEFDFHPRRLIEDLQSLVAAALTPEKSGNHG